MDKELNITEATCSTALKDDSEAAPSGMKHVKKLSNAILGKPRKFATTLFKPRTHKKSISAEEIAVLYEDSHCRTELSNFKLYCEAVDKTLSASAKSQTFPFDKHQRRSLNDNPNIFSDREEHDLNKIKQDLSQCKKDVKKLKENLNQFKQEFQEGIENLNYQLKQDQQRYIKLCYKIDNVTDLHQTQLEYLHSLIKNMEEDNNREQDECLLSMLCENLQKLETKILRL